MFPSASATFTPLIFAMSVIAIVYTSLVAFRQTDIKKLIAYSSVAHMGFVTMGIFSGNVLGVQGAVFQMISHGIISGALFLCVGVVLRSDAHAEIAFYGGLVNRMPWYAATFLLFTMGNVGLPRHLRFVGEILTMDRRLWRDLGQRDLDGAFRRHRRDPIGPSMPDPLPPRGVRHDREPPNSRPSQTWTGGRWRSSRP